jgi:4-amino-4-deoxy-L-arabinose transferase-like glycosyltransferase
MKKPAAIQFTATSIAWMMVGFTLLYLLSSLIHLGYFPLNGEEPRRAIVSIEMLESGNYIRPTTLGWEYYNKPPAYNWIMSFCMWLTGSTSEFSVRLPSVFFILCWGVCNYYIVRKMMPANIAALSSIFLVTTFELYFWGLNNGGEIDIFYSFIVYLQAMSIYYFSLRKRWMALYLASYLFCAIGFLTKGYPSIIFQGLTMLAFCVFSRSLRVVFRWQHLAGIALFVAVVGGYLYAYSFYSSPTKLLANLLRESFIKSAVGENSDKLLKKTISYPTLFLKILMPWALLLLLLLKKHSFRVWQNPLIRYSLLFVLFNIPVYWFTGIPKTRYIYMFIPFCMIAFAWIYYKTKEEHPALVAKVEKYMVIVFFILLAGLIAAPFIVSLNYTWLALAIAALLVYLFAYGKMKGNQIWYFAGGLVLARLIYALLFIPVQTAGLKVKYRDLMAAMAKANNYEATKVYKKAQPLAVEIDLKFTRLRFDTIYASPPLAYQMPYYYYQQTGKLVIYDTVVRPGQTYIGLLPEVRMMNPEILYQFRDKHQHNDTILLFRTQP